jgi:chromosomal replication initiation ATPase DnaA
MAAWATQELSDGSLADLARRLGRDATTMSSAVRRLLQRSKKDERLVLEKERMKELVNKFAALQG